MRVAVITPYHRCRRDWLAICLDSVKAQTHPCEHVVVCDGDDSFPPELQHAGLQLMRLPREHGDYGDTPRALGSISAFRQNFDAVAWLDADNWYLPEHIESLLQLQRETQAPICVSGRELYHLNGSRLGPCPETERGELVDTNCYLVTKEAKALANIWWLMEDKYHAVGDRYLYEYLKHTGQKIAASGRSTVCYRTAFASHYRHFGVEVPAEAKEIIQVKV